MTRAVAGSTPAEHPSSDRLGLIADSYQPVLERSSNGRTPGLEPGSEGSNPSLSAKMMMKHKAVSFRFYPSAFIPHPSFFPHALVVELVYTAVLEAAGHTPIQVRLLPMALNGSARLGYQLQIDPSQSHSFIRSYFSSGALTSFALCSHAFSFCEPLKDVYRLMR